MYRLSPVKHRFASTAFVCEAKQLKLMQIAVKRFSLDVQTNFSGSDHDTKQSSNSLIKVVRLGSKL